MKLFLLVGLLLQPSASGDVASDSFQPRHLREVIVVVDLSDSSQALRNRSFEGVLRAFEDVEPSMWHEKRSHEIHFEFYIEGGGSKVKGRRTDLHLRSLLETYGLSRWPVRTTVTSTAPVALGCTRATVVVTTEPQVSGPTLFHGFW